MNGLKGAETQVPQTFSILSRFWCSLAIHESFKLLATAEAFTVWSIACTAAIQHAPATRSLLDVLHPKL
jgi:hypothetical protein